MFSLHLSGPPKQKFGTIEKYLNATLSICNHNSISSENHTIREINDAIGVINDAIDEYWGII